MTTQALTPLQVVARCVADFPTIQEHVKYACSLGLKQFTPTMTPHNLEAVLVGSGPSVRTQINSLKSKRKKKNHLFFGIKGGHDFLLENGIEPHFGLAVDPLEKIHKENFLRKAKECKYFIASQCHPTLFDTLKERGEEIIVWHLATDNLGKWSKEPDSPVYRSYMIPGGSTSGLRAIVLAYSMGFRRFHLYGYDSCLSGDLRKVTGEHYTETKPDGSPKAMELVVGNRKFIADPAMASQANEFQTILSSLTRPNDPFFVKGYGDGLIQHIIKERYREGAAECLP